MVDSSGFPQDDENDNTSNHRIGKKKKAIPKHDAKTGACIDAGSRFVYRSMRTIGA